jgi:hypothetical protein
LEESLLPFAHLVSYVLKKVFDRPILDALQGKLNVTLISTKLCMLTNKYLLSGRFYCPNGTITVDPFRNDTTLRPYACTGGTYCLTGVSGIINIIYFAFDNLHRTIYRLVIIRSNPETSSTHNHAPLASFVKRLQIILEEVDSVRKVYLSRMR